MFYKPPIVFQSHLHKISIEPVKLPIFSSCQIVVVFSLYIVGNDNNDVRVIENQVLYSKRGLTPTLPGNAREL